MAKKYVIVIFSSWSKCIFSHFSKLISQFTEAALEVLLGKSILKMCSKLKGEYPCWNPISMAICKSWHRYLSISIVIGIGIDICIAKIYFGLQIEK